MDECNGQGNCVAVMEKYIGTKIVKARPMNLGDYHQYRGWVIPANENPAIEGFLVAYEDGYEWWSPKEAFVAYRKTSGMNFGLAIEALKKGCKVARAGWNGKNMWLVYMSGMTLPPFNTQGTDRKVNDRTAKWIGEDTPLETLPYIAMWTADKKWLPGWLASQTDMLVDDWMIVE